MRREDDPLIAGGLGDRPEALAFAREVRRVHMRYAAEVVGAFSLCPFMNDPSSAFGLFCVMLEPEPQVALAADTVVAAGSQVVHLVYPLTGSSCAAFERFGNALHRAVASLHDAAPVHATFHPEMGGDDKTGSHLIGLVRHAPDPFVQFVPEGLHKGGTMFIDPTSMTNAAAIMAAMKPPRDLRERLDAAAIAQVRSLLDDIKRDRDRSYAPFAKAFS